MPPHITVLTCQDEYLVSSMYPGVDGALVGFAGCIPGLHYVLKKQGIMKSLHCLNPDEVLSEGQAEEIDRLWKAYPEIADDSFVEAFMANENL